jgi:hypothetical protein
MEYNCNPGTDIKTGQPVGFTDRRTNHAPYKDSLELYDHYVNQINFLDWRHPLTGGLLWKAQHPESEAYYNSKPAKADVSCNDCHSPKVKDKKDKKGLYIALCCNAKISIERNLPEMPRRLDRGTSQL